MSRDRPQLIPYTKSGDMSMYGGDNKKARLSQSLIGDAMLRLIKSANYSDITVSMLCREAQVSRQTFYTLFGSKENVIIYLLQQSCCYEPDTDSAECGSSDFRMLCKGYSRYIIEKREILSLLVKNDMMHCLYDVQYESMMECGDFMREVTGDDRSYLIDFIACGLGSIAKSYVKTGCRSDGEFLERMMYRLFGGHYVNSQDR